MVTYYDYTSTWATYSTGRQLENGIYDGPYAQAPVEPKAEHAQARPWEMCGMAMADGIIVWSWRRQNFLKGS